MARVYIRIQVEDCLGWGAQDTIESVNALVMKQVGPTRDSPRRHLHPIY